jgi:transcriptional regulator with XRE-family HTH domain
MLNETHPVDVHVGQRLRKRRVMLGMAQTELAKHLGITFQQIQKYETGKNRIGASRLYEISLMLEVPVTFFFQEMPKSYNKNGMSDVAEQEEYGENEVMNRETLDLVKSYHKILDPTLRKKMLDTIKYIGSTFEFEVEE